MAAMMADEVALPTLLCSRPRATAEPAKQRRRPAPVPLNVLEDPAEAAGPALRVKNTFLEGAVQLSPSLELFYQARAMHTCPSKQIGCMARLLEEAASDVTEASTSPTATTLTIESPCNIETPLAEEAFLAYAYQPLCEMPHALPSMAMPIQMLQFGGAQVVPHALAPMGQAPLPAQEGHRAPKPVLNLADALGSEVVLAQQPEVSIEPPPQFVPGAGQTLGAVAGDFAMNLSAPSQPPPPPSGPALGTAELPSMGSRDHAAGCCKPCAFLHTKGCENGLACKFCHLCGPEERKRRRQEKLHERRELQKTRAERRRAGSEAS